MLLEEIIELATDDKQKLSVLLRKCLVLAQKLKNERLKAWANQELNGYASEEDLPEYRIVGGIAKGHFSGMFGERWNYFPIPPAVLEKKHQQFATEVKLVQAISAYEDLVSKSRGDGTFTFPWPSNLVLYYQERIPNSKNMILNAAYQEVARSSIVALVDTIRNRTLNMALELQSELGNQDLKNITPAEVAQIDRAVINNIYGGTNYFASGQSILHAATTNIQNSITVGDMNQLEAVLKNSGLSDEDVKQLSEAQKKDGGKAIGGSVTAWIKTAAPKVLAGGVKIATEVGQKLLTEWLKQYYGLPK